MTPQIVSAAWLIPAFPLVGAVVLLFFGKRMGRASGPFATAMMIGSLTVGAITFFNTIQLAERTFVQRLYSWITVGSFEVTLEYRIDPLSMVMILIITGVGALIHLYSIGYMKDDEAEPRFFAYLNLFAFSMLLLVLANDFLVMFVGWELVGLCSYLLIGFWFSKSENASAAKKAFITNRVGDLSFMIGLFLIVATFGSLSFDVLSTTEGISSATAAAIALLLFGGAAGKSAQIPLYVWLPDAMAGPTPVSALIHAATMVTAGVYMVARSHVFFDLSTVPGDVIAIVGVATALLAGFIALAQDDIKKVLAYSTVSQLGFMFIAIGMGAYATGVFHVVTHAFFKALLFLGAGSVMHALAGRTDITAMGGLWRKIPWTMVTFVVGWLAIIGLPGMSGYFSKDQILEAAYMGGKDVIWILGLIAAALTGLYMTRLVYLTFFGRSRVPDDVHPHESPPSMVFPLLVLAVLSVLGGLMNTSAHDGRLQNYLVPAIGPEVAAVEASDHGYVLANGRHVSETGFPEEREGGLSVSALSWIATAAGVGAALLSLLAYGLVRFDWQRRRENPSLFWRAARNKFFIDDVYQFLFTSLGRLGATALAFVVDKRWIDGVVNGAGTVTTRVASAGRLLQAGLVRVYAASILLGGAILLAYLVGRQVI